MVRSPSSDQMILDRVHALSAAAAENTPNPRYLELAQRLTQQGSAPLLTERQREKVVKYINELAEDFELSVQTGGLACNYFDRFVASIAAEGRVSGEKRNIQMIASTCLLIAAKFSDRKLPPLSELEKVHHAQCRADDFAALELKMLERLEWKLLVPLPHAFLEHLRALCPGAPFSASIEDRVLFFIDLSVYGYQFLSYSPCAVAGSAIITAWKLSDEHDAVDTHLPALARACQLPAAHLTECVNALFKYYQSCFPDAAKGTNSSLFIPISAADDSGRESRGPSECPSPELAGTFQSAASTACGSTWGGAPEAASPELCLREGPDTPASMLLSEHGGGRRAGRRRASPSAEPPPCPPSACPPPERGATACSERAAPGGPSRRPPIAPRRPSR